MNTRGVAANHRNYNGEAEWSVKAVQARYREYCDAFVVPNPRSLHPRQVRQEEILWTSPVMEEVIQGIEEGDAACTAIGVEFVEQDTLFPFGATLKSNTARALRRTSLAEDQRDRLRKRIVTMLTQGIVPREMREYVKLLRASGVGEYWPQLNEKVPRGNPYAMRFYRSLRAAEGLQT